MKKELLQSLLLTPKEKERAFKNFPCLDPSFEDDYSSEVAVLLEAQIKKMLKLGYKKDDNKKLLILH